jgi:hypothetical protein
MKVLESINDEEVLEELFSEHGVVLAYLFGSQAEGKAGPLSDVDIAVLLGPEIERETWADVQVDLMNALMDLLDRSDLDLVILNRATPVMAQRVAQHGRVLFEAIPGTRARFQIAALRRYVDTEHLRRIQNRAFLRRVEEYRTRMEEN